MLEPPPGGEDTDPIKEGTSPVSTSQAPTLAGTNLAGTNLGGPNLGGNNLAGTNLAGTNLAGTNFGGNNLGGNNLAGTNLAGTNLAGTNLAGTNLAGTNLAGTNLAGTNLAGTNLGGNNLAGTNLAGTNLAGTNTGYNIHGLGGGAEGMLYSGEDEWLPKTGQCVVLGIGSTAFAKLLAQQSANAKISVALGKLPWGFAKTKGAAVTLSAWEAIVWGDKTYCSFVLASPTNSSWIGVAGFVKSIFRWNAPPSQSMDISGIEASAEYDPGESNDLTNYGGMMNAAAQFRAGKISERNFVAGELAFVTATTNNQAVKIDYASWVTDSTKTGLVLGNVQSNSPPIYAESVYYAVDNGDGTVGVRMYFPPQVGTMISSNLDLDAAYKAYQQGGPKPVPRRCGGALWLNGFYGEPVPSGKRDNGLSWYTSEIIAGTRLWSTVAGTTAPMNQYMVLPADANHIYQRSPNGGVLKTVLSETYVHMWERNYDLPGGGTNCRPAYLSSNCPLYVTGTQVSRNGHNYTCANSNCTNCGASSSCAPGATGCAWGSVWTDNGSCL